MQLIRIINKGLMFVLELCMLAALFYWGFHHPGLEGYLLGIGTPVFAAVLWGVFAAPKSNKRLSPPYRIVFSLTIFLTSGILLYLTGQTVYASTLMIAAVICQSLVLLLGE